MSHSYQPTAEDIASWTGLTLAQADFVLKRYKAWADFHPEHKDMTSRQAFERFAMSQNRWWEDWKLKEAESYVSYSDAKSHADTISGKVKRVKVFTRDGRWVVGYENPKRRGHSAACEKLGWNATNEEVFKVCRLCRERLLSEGWKPKKEPRRHSNPKMPMFGPCSCRPGVQRDNCPACEGTGYRIDFATHRADVERRRCPACKGFGSDPASTHAQQPCSACNGAGFFKNPNRHGLYWQKRGPSSWVARGKHHAFKILKVKQGAVELWADDLSYNKARLISYQTSVENAMRSAKQLDKSVTLPVGLRDYSELGKHENPRGYDVAIAFAQGATKGRGFGAIFIDGDTIYSYGHHWPIATRTTDGGLVLLNANKRSMTTSKHTSYVRRALESVGVRYMESDKVSNGKVDYPSEDFEKSIQLRRLIKEAEPARREFRRGERLRKSAGISSEAWWKKAPRNNPKAYWFPKPYEKYWRKTTDASWFDGVVDSADYYKKNKGVVGFIRLMPPSEYLQLAAKMQGHFDYNYYLTHEVVSEKTIEEYAHKMERGIKFPIPYLDYSQQVQEGRHRAFAADRIGMSLIPVLEVFPVDLTRKNPPRTLIGRKATEIKMTDGHCQGSFGACYGLADGSAFIKGLFTKVPKGRVQYIAYMDEAKAKREGLNPPDRPWKHDFSSHDVVAVRCQGGIILKSKVGTPLWGNR